jgi:hypothetical protein
MSRVVVRTAIADWVKAAEIFDDVRRGKVQFQTPKFVAGTPNYRTVAYVLLSNAHESRIAMGGPTSGVKQIDYTAHVVMHFWSIDPDWEAAQDRFDEVIDLLKAQIRTGGRTLGRPDVVLQAGEWAAGIDDQVTEPVTVAGAQMTQVASVSFEVTELIFS